MQKSVAQVDWDNLGPFESRDRYKMLIRKNAALVRNDLLQKQASAQSRDCLLATLARCVVKGDTEL
eukprot:9916490-Karenia_brevis.AAC.1